MSIFDLFKPRNNKLLVKKGASLLAAHKSTIKELKSIIGVPQKYWKYLYYQTLIQFAEYVQELPASEAHHHSGRGGLLAHTLDTTLYALKMRRGKKLPPNSDAETETRLKDLWTYAVFISALGHDLGKPLTDVDIKLLDKTGKALGQWSPFKGSMTKIKDAYEYKITYKKNRLYQAHERSSALYLYHIVPITCLEWLQSDYDVFFHFISMMTGHHEDGGIIASMIHDADRQSVATNLAGDQVSIGSSDQAAQTNRKPLYQRIVTSLRHEIDEGRLPLNRDGAAGWRTDDKLWLVVKRVIDQVRDRMTQEGQSGIPARNDRIMDELQQYQVLLANGDRSIWKCRVFSPDWPKAHELNLICIPINKLWSTESSYPEQFNGTVEPLNTNAIPVDTDSQQSTESNEPNNENQPTETASVPTNEPQAILEHEPLKESKETTPEQTNQTSKPTIQPPSLDFQKLAEDTAIQSSSEINNPKVEAPIEENKPTVDNQVVSQADNKKPIRIPSGVVPSGNKKDRVEGDDFIKWLRDGLNKRSFSVNDVNSKVHMTKEGLLLVSPAIFRVFDKDKWSYVQKRFTKLKLHERNTNGTNIHEYMVTGKKKKSMIKGFIISDTDNVFPGIELPNINHALSKIVT